MNIIIVTGKASKSGKTTLITKIINNLTSSSKGVGVIKCSINKDFREPLVTDAPEIINAPGTDTARMAKAGSIQTILIKSTRDMIGEALAGAARILKDLDFVLVEGNSAVEYLTADLIIYLDNEELQMKPSAEEARKKADIIIDARNLFMTGEVSEISFKFNLETLGCPKALLTASVLNYNPLTIGKKLNQEKVKLKGCQLGCF